jgi:hypothetical protein
MHLAAPIKNLRGFCCRTQGRLLNGLPHPHRGGIFRGEFEEAESVHCLRAQRENKPCGARNSSRMYAGRQMPWAHSHIKVQGPLSLDLELHLAWAVRGLCRAIPIGG